MRIVIFRVSCDYPPDQKIADDAVEKLKDELKRTIFDESAAFLDFSPPEKIGDRNYIKVRFQPTGTKPLNESAIIETVKGVMEHYVTDVHYNTGLSNF